MRKVEIERKQDHTDGSAADWTEIRLMPVGMLQVDPKYQRNLDVGWAKQIAANFDPDQVGIMQVSYRDGLYWVFDGQHTMTAIRIKFHDSNYPVTCKIYHGLSETEEARLFYKFNSNKKKMAYASMLKAQAAYGDEDVQSFLDHTRTQGFLIDPVKRMTGRFGIQAVKKAQDCFHALGADGYDRMLSLIKQTWDGESWSVTQNMLGGMCALVKTFGEKLSDKIFISQLSKANENQIIRESGRFCEESASVAYASALVSIYNKGIRRTNQLKRTLLLED